jgi:DNA helicase II / ATP-dependent DNA helicase PcrA
MERFARIVQDIEVNVKKYYNKDLETAEKNDLKKTVAGMFRITNLRDLYREFYQWIGKPELFRLASQSRFEYADVFPLIYLKFRLTGNKPFENVRHLLIDEMQDYTPIQYAVLSRLFVCNKTILGDSYQKLNPYASSDTSIIKRVFPAADMVLLRRSYRSSYEITNFAQQILPDKDLIAIERHGEKPVVRCLTNNKEELSEIIRQIESFHQTAYHSFGIICKTQKQAETLYDKLQDYGANINLLNSQSASFIQGITLTSVQLAKGLEFDKVLLPFVNSSNYQTETDRSLLYIACTRAMHALMITCHPKENLSRFLRF